MDAPLDLTLQIVITVIAGIGAQVLAEFVKIPGIVFLLIFGILLGPSAFGVLHPDRLGNGLEVLVALLVAVILFEGGFNLQLRDLGRVSGSLRNLVTIGTLITLVGGGMAAHWLSEFPWALAFLYGALVVVTGPVVINSLLRQVDVDRQVATILEGEGVLIDPVGAILAVVVLNVLLNGNPDPLTVASDLGIRLGVGTTIGAGGGWLLGVILKRATFLSEDLKNLVVLAGLWGLFGLAQMIRSEAGLMATVIAGIVLRASALPEERLLKRFKGQLTILATSVLFILLSADLSIAGVLALGWGGLSTVLALMIVVRPLSVWLCTWNSDLTWRQKLFLSWIAPRGIIAASVASLFAILLTQRGINGGDSIKALVFLTIILTVVIQALTAQWTANLLQITSKDTTGVIIVGCSPLSLLIARLFLERDELVALIDTDPDSHPSLQPDLKVFISSALDTDVLEEAGLSKVGTFLAMTNNGEVNLVVAQRAIEEFSPPRVLAIFPRDSQVSGLNSRVQQAFSSQILLKVWNQYLNEGAVKLGETTLKEAGLDLQQAHLRALVEAESLIPLLIERNGSLQIAPVEGEWQVGDRLIYLLHDPKPKLLKLLSGSSQLRLTLEELPEVEEIPMLPVLSGAIETVQTFVADLADGQ
ncbi:sodium:proton antiporter [Phormidesmis priestleyi ULC007]|uniref:Sodium:proton antiporter n=1 Tax=Phormidesmis priestleyi ULC007 TaxID=1920490 RepID=A0A2T1DLD9_9CYAN|nr:sodium:proton antiporter [Phormidesmis priestleyi]PSB21292.1 sodium:proton antiporter [Phormidesmis priestleyi ULC007]PZO50663.1 MAG: sodium:proton antiporter [Phormidesmis priestleyi]